jgi:PAS domain S-box-containing protein/putative nucleotidyltransferase with HDIG domain
MVGLPEQVQKAGGESLLDLVRHSSDLLVVVNQEAVVLFANPAASAMLGVPLDDAIGKDAFHYIHPDDHEHAMINLARLVRSPGTPITDTLRVVSADGQVRVLETVTTNCLHEPGIDGLVINGRDVTERNEYIIKLEKSFDAITVAVAKMVELRDPYTAGHQRHVARIATAIARDLALSEDEIKGIAVAALLHDIGKIAIPAEILTRPGPLSPAEFEIIKSHPEAGHLIVADVPFPWPVAQIILQHHERLDGSGYPNGLTGTDILFGSRIVAVADVVSAMSARRPYRPAIGLAKALTEIEINQNQLYDATVVDACLRLFRERRFEARDSDL